MLPTPAPSPELAHAPARAPDTDELCTSGSEREWDELIAAFPLPDSLEPRRSPVPRPRSATVSADIMRSDARRAVEVASAALHGEATTSVLAENVSVTECATTAVAPFVFPSIGPAMTTPLAAPATPLTQCVVVTAELAVPRPKPATPSVVQLEDTVAAGPTISTARKGKKRARIDSTSPSPASAARPQTSTPVTPPSRIRLPTALRATDLGPARRATPGSSRGRLAAITEALRAIPGGKRLAPGGRTAPTRPHPPRGELAAPSASRTRSRVENEDPTNSQATFNMNVDLDLQLEYAQASPRSPSMYGMPLQPVDINRLRFPEAFHRMGPLPEGPDKTGAYQDPPDMIFRDDHAPRGVLSVRDRPPTPHPIRVLSGATATPPRTVSHSAAALAVSFTASQPIPIPGATRLSAPNATMTTYRTTPSQFATDTMSTHQFTDVPDGDFLVIYRTDPDGLFAGLTQARGVALHEQNTLIAMVHNLGNPGRLEMRPIVATVASVIRHVSGDLNPLVVAPVRDWSAANKRKVAPQAFGVIGLTVEGPSPDLPRPPGFPVASGSRRLFHSLTTTPRASKTSQVRRLSVIGRYLARILSRRHAKDTP
ncbi:hypothetical protein VTO73DRAFT_9272 [Trametes versicolor]